MPEYEINGVQVHFPFEPYDVQRNYMSKVIEALQGSTNAVLESPTGTGKTLCLLCSSLAWLQTKKAQVQASKHAPMDMLKEKEGLVQPANCLNNLKDDFMDDLNFACGAKGGAWGVPKIIYASRTHSQLSQAMAEMKRTTYSYMKAAVVGSRDQLCIHPDVTKESGNSNKIYMCRAHVQARTCGFYQRLEGKKDHPDFREASVMDIEDLIAGGKKHKCCPYFLSKEMVERADIIFMPYNYLLDPKARKANNIELHNSIVILDEAHNVEKMCEESASIQLKSSDVALCMEEITNIMRKLDDDKNLGFVDDVGGSEDGQSFTIEDLATLKELLMRLEDNIDNLKADAKEGTTHPGNFIFELLNQSGFNETNSEIIRKLLDDLIQWITAATQAQGKGISSNATGLSMLSDVLTIVFAGKGAEFHERVRRCYKVHIGIEEQKKEKSYKKNDGWTSMGKAPPSVKNNAKVVSYWCFNPGFGMTQVLNKNVRSVILTSGTLAPLKPLISELGIPVNVRLENPHIIKKSQVYVRIVSHGPDNEQLVSNYENRNNPKYVASLGRTIMNFCPVIPSGLLVFFPSYFIMNKCMDDWQASGLWSQISAKKPIFIEPRTKEEFTVVMNNYYAKINDPNGKGAIFMAVCRGKVSEGLDFADMNGRGVIITGLPFPPVKDPRVVLKRRYLEENRTRENEILSGAEWYGLEATRAVNQAIGRVIRHKDDYGAILLCDQRFNNRNQKDQLSKWLQGHLQQSFNPGFGTIMKELSMFFKEAARTLPKPSLKPTSYEEGSSKASEILQAMNVNAFDDRVPNYKIALSDKNDTIENANKVQSWSRADYEKANIKVNFPHGKDFFGGLKTENSSIDFNDVSSYDNAPSLVTIHKRNASPSSEQSQDRRKKYKIIPNIKQEIINLVDSADEKSPAKFTTEIAKENPLTLINATSEDTVTVWRRNNKFKENYQTLDEIQREAKALPVDRMQFLKLMKTDMDTANYKLFLVALSDYRKNQNLELLLSRLKNVFDVVYLFPYLMEMKRFVNDLHKSRFDIEIPSFIIGKLKDKIN